MPHYSRRRYRTSNSKKGSQGRAIKRAVDKLVDALKPGIHPPRGAKFYRGRRRSKPYGGYTGRGRPWYN